MLWALCGFGYAASATAAEAPPEPRVYRDRVEAHWLKDNTRFWYRVSTGRDASEFVLVDATAGRRAAAFDHARVAETLGHLTGTKIAATNLPVEELDFPETAGVVRLLGGATNWLLNLATYDITAETNSTPAASLPFDLEPRPSKRTGPETELTFVNRLGVEVELFWMDDAGERRSYGRLAAGQEKQQHTFAGHVWLVTAPARGVVAVFEAARRPARAVVDDSTPARRKDNSSEPTAPRAVPSPDGKWEAFVRDHNLWMRELASGRESALSADGSPGLTYHKDVSRDRMMGMEYDKPEPPATLPQVEWSPDSKRLVALQTRVAPERRVYLVESSPKDQLQPKLHSYPYLKAGDEIPVQTPKLFEIESRRAIPIDPALFPNPWDVDFLRWATNGARFTFVYNQRGHQVMRVIAVDAATGAAGAIVEERTDTVIDHSSKFLCEWLGDGELIWMSERDGWNHLYLYDVSNGRVKQQLTRGEWNIRAFEHLDAAKRQLWFWAVGIEANQDPYHRQLCALDFSSNEPKLTRLTEGDGTHAVEWSPDRRWFIDTWSRVDVPPRSVLRRGADGGLVCELETADASEVLAARGRFPERFTAKGRDGATDIWGILHRPKNFDPEKRYPVVENIYAGPHDFHVPKSFRARYRTQEELADRGFIVAQIDGMGTSWRSRKFHDVAWRNLKDAGFPDRIAWLRAAAEKFPEIDLTRVGIYGGSAGGQNALAALLWHGNVYRAAVADCGCHDNRMDKIWWSEQWMGWPVGPWYEENSNVVNAQRLQGELLLITGELDRNVDPASTMQVASALTRAGKKFDLLVVPGAGHGAAEAPYGSQRRLDFFVRHLLRAPPAPPIGERAPEIDGIDVDGAAFRLSDFRGRVVMLVFWGDWCPDCRARYPHEREIVERYANDSRFVLLGVNSDSAARLRLAKKRESLPWQAWFDGGGREGPIARRWGIGEWPTTCLIDARGVLRNRFGEKPDAKEIDAAIEALLREVQEAPTK